MLTCATEFEPISCMVCVRERDFVGDSMNSSECEPRTDLLRTRYHGTYGRGTYYVQYSIEYLCVTWHWCSHTFSNTSPTTRTPATPILTRLTKKPQHKHHKPTQQQTQVNTLHHTHTHATNMVKSSSVLGCAAVIVIPLVASTASAESVPSGISELVSQPSLQQPWIQSDQVNGKPGEKVQVVPLHLRHAPRDLGGGGGKCTIL
jgi:hypothetical protein